MDVDVGCLCMCALINRVVETDIYRAFVEKFENDFKANGSAIFPPDGSTASVCLIVGDVAYFANCGDSSMICILRNNEVVSVSDRHNTSNREELRRIRLAGGRVGDRCNRF
jgi:serine/threonine protein phosphatase PrpC